MKGAERPRLLIVGAFPPADRQVFGGMVTSCRALLQSSLPARASLDLLDSTQISVPPPALPVRFALAMLRLVRYVYRLERRRPDAVLLFAAVGASLAEKGMMTWYARMRGLPVLMFPRGGGIIDASRVSSLTRGLVRWAFGGATMLLCQSSKWHDFACRLLDFPASRAPVIPNWTATPDLLAIGHSRGLREGGPVRLLFLGWLEREKGVGELLDACRQLRTQRSFTLDIAGEGNFSAAARDLVERHRIADVVHFRGWLRGDALRAALAETDVLVLPSWAEGLPNAMIEAMAARLAIVVTAVGSIPDVVTDGRDALLVPPRDVLALERALSRVIDDRDLRQRLGDAALALAEAQFGVEPAIDKIITAIGQAIGRTQGPPSSNPLRDEESPSGR